MSDSSAISVFAYRAQASDGAEISGTINATDLTDAGTKLGALSLRVLELAQAPAARSLKPKSLRGEDFVAFNQHLAQLTSAGMPIEQGLRLIARDVRSRRLATTIDAVAAELERGTPLGEAFDHHRGAFPALYGRLIDAGVRSNNLAGMLFNLGRHVELVQRLRASLWRIVAYPLVVLIALAGVFAFLSFAVLPAYVAIFRDFGTRLPVITQTVLWLGDMMPQILAIAAAILVAIGFVWLLVRATRSEGATVQHLVLPLPLIGPVIRRSGIARWCDAVRLGVEAGLDLPAAIDLAADAVAWPVLRRDGERLIAALSAGRPLVEGTELGADPGYDVLPATVIASIALATRRDQLPAAMDALARMSVEQSEARLAAIPAILTPLLLIFLAIVIGFVVIAMFAPMVSFVQAVSSPSK